MVSLLAQVDAAAVGAVADMVSRPDALAHPTLLVPGLRELPIAAAWVMLVMGVVGVSHGVRVHRPAVLIAALVTGLWIGYHVGEPRGGEVILAICFGTLMGVLAWPLMPYAVMLFTAGAGAVLGAHLWAAGAGELMHRPVGEASAWIACGIAFALTLPLAVRLPQTGLVLLTSVAGSLLLVTGLVAVALNVPAVDEWLATFLHGRPLTLPLAMTLTTIAGLVMQRRADDDALVKDPAGPAVARV